MHYNVEEWNRIQEKIEIPPRAELLRPDFHHETSKYQSEHDEAGLQRYLDVDVSRGCVGVNDCEWVSGNQSHGHVWHRYINTKVGVQSRCMLLNFWFILCIF